MAATIYVNGRITGENEAVVPVLDHGFLYGDGVYEVMRTYAGRPFLFGPHMERMRRSASMIDLPVPFTDEGLLAEMGKTADRFYQVQGEAGRDMELYIRILLTRGVGAIGYDPRSCPAPTLVIIIKPQVDPPAETYEKGVMLSLVPIVRNHPSSLNPRIKSNNLLNNALAWQQASRRGGYDGIMRNYRGEISECAQSNLFVVKGGTVKTPPLEDGLLPGITRAFVMELAHDLGLPMLEATLHDEDLFAAEEVFLTGTTREIVPIVGIDDRAIGSGLPGGITWKLLKEFRRRVARDYYGQPAGS